MARLAAIAVLLATGCGRVGFDDLPLVTMDGPVQPCAAAQVPGVDLGPQAPVVGIAGTGTPLGYALAVQRGDATAVDGLIVAADLSDATPSSPARSTPVEGFNTTYERVVLQWDGTRILGGLVTDQGVFYWKTFPDNMGQYTSAVEETPTQQPAVPFFATADGQRFAVSFAGQQLTRWELDADGIPTGVSTAIDVGRQITAAGVIPRDEVGSIAVIEAEGLGLFAIVLGSPRPRAAFLPIDIDPIGTRPVVTGTATQVHVTYVRGSELVVRTIDSSSLQVSPVRVVAPVSPGFFGSTMRGDQLRVVWSDAAGIHIGIDGAAFETIDVGGLPTDAPDSWTVVARDSAATVFAAYDDALWSIPICD